MALTSTVLMIRPSHFGFNEEAFRTNKFQKVPDQLSPTEVQAKALEEFEAFVQELESLDVEVVVFDDDPKAFTPDAIFPNNWFSTHPTGEIITYAMAHENRRRERRMDIVHALEDQYGLKYAGGSDSFEIHDMALEGTGSLIFDHSNKTVYAALSPRTNLDVLKDFCIAFPHEMVTFEALGSKGELIYHTNVMLTMGDQFALIGTDTIKEEDREKVLKALQDAGKELIELTNEQVYESFAGNMLQIKNRKNEKVMIMSQRAHDSLTEWQKVRLAKYNDHFAIAPLDIIETVGGGSARCMVAEVFGQ